ncbi:hypothetical protein GCM10009596_22220 [Arthrobacter rhombi]
MPPIAAARRPVDFGLHCLAAAKRAWSGEDTFRARIPSGTRIGPAGPHSAQCTWLPGSRVLATLSAGADKWPAVGSGVDKTLGSTLDKLPQATPYIR